MSLGVELTLDQLPGYGAALAKAVLDGDFSPALRDCRIAIVADVRTRFDTATTPEGIPWLPLKNPSARRGGASAKPLRDKGILSAAATGGANSTTQIGRVSLALSIKLAYAAVQNFGHTFTRPARSRVKPWRFVTPGGKVVFTRRIRGHVQVVQAREFAGFSEKCIETCGLILTDHAAKKWTG